MRVVHSLFASTDDWDDQLEGFESGWPAFFRILRLYLTHFLGQHSSTVQLMGMAQPPESNAWDALTGPLGLAGATLGERRNAPAAVPPLAGWVEHVGEGALHALFLRLDEPTPGIAHLFAHQMGAQVLVAIRIYLYGDRALAVVARDEPLWRTWMNQCFPMGVTRTTARDEGPSSPGSGNRRASGPRW